MESSVVFSADSTEYTSLWQEPSLSQEDPHSATRPPDLHGVYMEEDYYYCCCCVVTYCSECHSWVVKYRRFARPKLQYLMTWGWDSTYYTLNLLPFLLTFWSVNPGFLNNPQDPSHLTELLQTSGLILGLGLTASVNCFMFKKVSALGTHLFRFQIWALCRSSQKDKTFEEKSNIYPCHWETTRNWRSKSRQADSDILLIITDDQAKIYQWLCHSQC